MTLPLHPHPSAEPFLSLLLVLTEIDFSLDLQNCSFLDESWLLPVHQDEQTCLCYQGWILLSACAITRSRSQHSWE